MAARYPLTPRGGGQPGTTCRCFRPALNCTLSASTVYSKQTGGGWSSGCMLVSVHFFLYPVDFLERVICFPRFARSDLYNTAYLGTSTGRFVFTADNCVNPIEEQCIQYPAAAAIIRAGLPLSGHAERVIPHLLLLPTLHAYRFWTPNPLLVPLLATT
jgi:hypothetical protein